MSKIEPVVERKNASCVFQAGLRLPISLQGEGVRGLFKKQKFFWCWNPYVILWLPISLQGEGVRRWFKYKKLSQKPQLSHYVGVGRWPEGGGGQKPLTNKIVPTCVYFQLAAPGWIQRQMGLW